MIVLVTGATSGFGKEIATNFVKEGHVVIGTGRRKENLDQLKDALGENFIPLAFDLADMNATETAINNLPDKWLQNIDILVNNAGLALGVTPAHESSFEDWQTMIQVNILGLTKLTHLILPHMVAKNSGLIVNVGSIAGNYPYFGGNVYGASKAFVRQFSLNLRADLYGKHIRVTNIEPGMCGGTEFSNVRLKGDDEKANQVYENINYVTATDIANIVTWVANQPDHVNINSLEVMPTAQTFNGLRAYREESE